MTLRMIDSLGVLVELHQRVGGIEVSLDDEGGDARNLLEPRRRHVQEVQLPGLQQVDLGILVGHDAHDDPLQSGLFPPVVRVGRQGDVIVGDELRDVERTGPNRLLVERRPVDLVRCEGPEHMLGHDRRSHHLIAERSVRLL
jgi:hypothetical protein